MDRQLLKMARKDAARLLCSRATDLVVNRLNFDAKPTLSLVSANSSLNEDHSCDNQLVSWDPHGHLSGKEA